MGKQGELWDDSALINAFDEAISKYKVMHGKRNENTSTEGSKIDSSVDENFSAAVDESHEGTRDEDERCNVNSSTASAEVRETTLSPITGNLSIDSCAPLPYSDSSNGLNMQNAQDVHQSYSITQSAESYNELLSQYYELEEKRQKILEQLHQYNGSNYQEFAEGSGNGMQWSVSSPSQGHPTAPVQASDPHLVCSCCLYACPLSVDPCSSFPNSQLYGACTVGNTCTDASVARYPGCSIALADSDVARTAMGAAKKAIISTKTKISSDSAINGDEEKEKNEGNVAQNIKSETDLTDVLNAWYSAGFYTGKYLVEQSLTKKNQS